MQLRFSVTCEYFGKEQQDDKPHDDRNTSNVEQIKTHLPKPGYSSTSKMQARVLNCFISNLQRFLVVPQIVLNEFHGFGI